MGNAYTRHHFVPVTYLKQFSDLTATQNKMIWRRKIKAQFKSSPDSISASSVCFRDHYYKLDKQRVVEKYNLNSSLYIEIDGFKKYENSYEENIHKIIANDIEIDFREARVFLKGLVLLKLRNPYVKEVVFNKSEIEDSAQQAINFLREKNISTNNPLYLEGFLAAVEKLNKEVRDKSNHKSIYLEILLDDLEGRNKLSEGFIDTLMQSNWVILKSRKDQEFLTCDNPGFCIDRKTNNVFNIKVDGKICFCIPLTPYYFLCISNDSPDIKSNYESKRLLYRDADESLVNYLNSNTIIVANSEIYSNTIEAVSKCKSNL